MADSEPRHEMRDAPARVPLVVIVFMVVFVPLGLGLVWVLLNTVWSTPPSIDDPFADKTSLMAPVESPAPALQPSPQSDLAAFEARMTREMSHYGWVDRQANIVRLPIERAMTLLVERGLPPRQGPVPDRRLPPNPDPDAATQWVAPPPANGAEEASP
ncbi:hypothetical protein SAMN05661010_02415 [Modicisalibacter muralis]|uniref:Uncharacterized protein n=1 Tax=Modicisalibacter muralis TaxID=119000 RepID=A0A1G9MCX0_9GAMM|nr:hypothetical protein [Halomonas muralis]SDL72118.1 hypothetical protein SAMN05661010_02415 [Halomonas muralis]